MKRSVSNEEHRNDADCRVDRFSRRRWSISGESARMKNDRLSETTQDSTDNGKVPGSRELGRGIRFAL